MIRDLRVNEISKLIECIQLQGQDAKLSYSDKIDPIYLAQIVKQAVINQNYKILVTTIDDKIVGFCAGWVSQKFWNPKQYGEILFIYIHPGIRNKKRADALFDGMVEWFKEMDCEYYFTSVLHFNEQYKPETEYMEKGFKYFKAKGLTPLGSYFIKELKDESI
jgi:ribosomal protein S18 acetylase RimI-like enzyme